MARRLYQVLMKKKKNWFTVVYFTMPANYIVKIKERETIDKYLHRARERKKCGLCMWRYQLLLVIGGNTWNHLTMTKQNCLKENRFHI